MVCPCAAGALNKSETPSKTFEARRVFDGIARFSNDGFVADNESELYAIPTRFSMTNDEILGDITRALRIFS